MATTFPSLSSNAAPVVRPNIEEDKPIPALEYLAGAVAIAMITDQNRNSVSNANKQIFMKHWESIKSSTQCEGLQKVMQNVEENLLQRLKITHPEKSDQILLKDYSDILFKQLEE